MSEPFCNNRPCAMHIIIAFSGDPYLEKEGRCPWSFLWVGRGRAMSPCLPLFLIIYPPVYCPYENLHHFLRGKVHAFIGHSINNVLQKIVSSRSAELRVKAGLHDPQTHRRVSLGRLLQNGRFLSGRTVFQATAPALGSRMKCKEISTQAWVRGVCDACNSLAAYWIVE